jgi:hypothetical protein
MILLQKFSGSWLYFKCMLHVEMLANLYCPYLKLCVLKWVRCNLLEYLSLELFIYIRKYIMLKVSSLLQVYSLLNALASLNFKYASIYISFYTVHPR